MGLGLDRRCVHYLKVDYDELVERVLAGDSDEAVLQWCFSRGYRPSASEMLVWNEFLIKRGWRDTDAPAEQFQEYKEKYGLGGRDDILTYFDFYEVDEGRKP
jgi:hypothetical protein